MYDISNLLFLLLPFHSGTTQPSIKACSDLIRTWMVFFNLLLHVETRWIYAGRQALIALIKCTNAKSHTERCSALLAPSLSFHVHASADVITVSAASVAQRCETKSRSPPSIIKSFLAIGQLTLASRTVPFHFHQSCHPYCKRGKDCQMILARSHHSQPLIVWSSERRLETLLYVRFFCEVSRLCCQLQAMWLKSWLFYVTFTPTSSIKLTGSPN